MDAEAHDEGRHMTDRLGLIYSSLYLDEGESWEFAEKQVDECILNAKDLYPMHRIGLALDVVATPAQIARGEARRLAMHLLAYIDERYPRIRARFVTASPVTTADARGGTWYSWARCHRTPAITSICSYLTEVVLYNSRQFFEKNEYVEW